MNESMTTPFSTATPDSAIKPIPAEIDIGISRNANATTPPVKASGTPENTMAASRADLNSMNSSPKISISANGTTTCNRVAAD